MNGIARRLKGYSFNSVHLITPFDSGGSSQVLRRAFDMPAVGDLRAEVATMIEGGHPLISAISRPMRQLIQAQLRRLADEAPRDFDYRTASIGNLIFACGYLCNGRALDPCCS